jgi:hypothetical protein
MLDSHANIVHECNIEHLFNHPWMNEVCSCPLQLMDYQIVLFVTIGFLHGTML